MNPEFLWYVYTLPCTFIVVSDRNWVVGAGECSVIRLKERQKIVEFWRVHTQDPA